MRLNQKTTNKVDDHLDTTRNRCIGGVIRMMENMMLIRAAHSTHVNPRDTNQYVSTRFQSIEPGTDTDGVFGVSGTMTGILP